MSSQCGICEVRGIPFKQWPRKQKIGVLGLAALLVMFAFLSDESGPFMTWMKSLDQQAKSELIGSRMRQLADQGKPEAVIWMANNFRDEPGRVEALEKLAESGDANALYALIFHKAGTDREQAKVLMKRAADAGNPAAMLALARSPEPFKP